MKILITLLILSVVGMLIIGCSPQGKYEYLLINMNCSKSMFEGEVLTCSSDGFTLESFDDILNHYSNNGWRVINIDPYYNAIYQGQGNFYSMFITLERPK